LGLHYQYLYTSDRRNYPRIKSFPYSNFKERKVILTSDFI